MKIKVQAGDLRWESNDFGGDFSADDEFEELKGLVDEQEEGWSKNYSVEVSGGTEIERDLFAMLHEVWGLDDADNLDSLEMLMQALDYACASEANACKLCAIVSMGEYVSDWDEICCALDPDSEHDAHGYLRACWGEERAQVVLDCAREHLEDVNNDILGAIDKDKLTLSGWQPLWIHQYGNRWYAVINALCCSG